ncbi:MAG: prepilin-type N-terminal cleavage/methylation domain-containing protein, partial [Planctomycetota bacterium]
MMKKTNRSRRNHGFSLVEVTVATSIMAIVLMIAVGFVTTAKRTTETSNERAFAVQKAISLLEEVRNFTQQVGDFAELDVLDNGVVTDPFLTILNVPSPGHVSSGNISDPQSSTGWRFSRILRVAPFQGKDIRDLRIVTAFIYKELANGTRQPLADVGTVLRSPGNQAFPTTQVYDVYFLGLENIPGWWVYMANIRPLLEGRVADLQARNPGLEFRSHWITKSSFGRNPRYRPYINEAVDSYEDVDQVYFYPGTMPDGSAAEQYYVPHQIKALINIDGVVKNDYDVNLNPFPYTLADEYNHGMRYIDELRLFNNRCDAAVDPPLEDAMTPTWRILLEKMCTDPEAFENAILINLHGELLPMPAVRNYSDAARDPANYPGVRVVTHPRYLCTPMDNGDAVTNPTLQATRDLQLRVYAYKDLTDRNLGAIPNTLDKFTVVIRNVDLSFNVNGATDPSLRIKRIYGGVDGSFDATIDGGADPYGLGDASDPELHCIDLPTNPPPATAPDARMCYHVWCDDTDPTDEYPGNTVITFYNTPLVCPLVQDPLIPPAPAVWRGLPPQWRLYGNEYIPSSTEAGTNAVVDFSRDLTDTTTNPKNTARWIIEIPNEVNKTASLRDASGIDDELSHPYDGLQDVIHRLTVATTLGTTNDAESSSLTYAWWTDDETKVPFTERSQFMGDPRHSPYADLKDTATVHWTYTALGMDAYK